MHMIHFKQNDIDIQLRYQYDGPSGTYDQLNWKVMTGMNAADIASQTVSVHEFMHNELNNTTVYGFLLQGYAYLSREETSSQQHFGSILGALVDSCRIVHEVYATWMSINLLSTDIHDMLYQELLEDNEEYLDYYTRAASIVRLVPDLYLRRHIITAIIAICFQSRIVATSAIKDLATFDPDVLKREEFPDQRLAFIANRFDDHEWMDMLHAFAETQKEQHWYPLLHAALSGKGDDSLLSSYEYEANSTELLVFIYDRLDAKLRKYGLLSMPYLSHLAYFKEMMPLLDQIAPFSRSANPLALNAQPNDSTRSTLQNFENETLLFSNMPLACIILEPGGISRKTRDQVLSGVGENPHILLTGRTYHFMQEQYVFLEKDDAAWCEKGNGSFTAIRYAGDMGGRRIVVYIPFSKPAELKDFLKDKPAGIPLLSSISETASYDEEWWQQWGSFFESEVTTAAILLDVSPLHYIETVLNNAPVLLYDKIDLRMGEQVRSAMLFQVKYDGETIALIACPCSEIYARGLHHYIETRFTSFKKGIALSREHMQHLPAIMSHVFREEHQHYYRSKNQ